jgi:hypothetical protein
MIDAIALVSAGAIFLMGFCVSGVLTGVPKRVLYKLGSVADNG